MCSLQDKKTLRETSVDNSVAHLQEELIAVKLREAEANLSLKDLRHRVQELSAQWQRHLQVSQPIHQIRAYILSNHLEERISQVFSCEYEILG